MRRRSLAVIAIALYAFFVAGCGLLPGQRINPVYQAGLADTVRIEVKELNSWGTGDEPYLDLLTITDRPLLGELISALNTDLRVTLKLMCIPEYELHFHLADGSVQTFGYSCDGASFIRGDQDFWRGEDYSPPGSFDARLGELLAATYPSEINVTVEADLAHTVRIALFETVSKTVEPEGGDGEPAIVEAQVLHRLNITDKATIARVVTSLDTVVKLLPRVQVATPYVLQFYLEDGTSRTVGYASGGEGGPILRVDGMRSFKNQQAVPPAAFEALVAELLAAETDDS